MEEKFKCEGKNCGHEWPLKQEAHPYLCHECGFDSETHTYNFPALDAWEKSQIAKGEKPYIEERNDNIIRRTFSESVDEHELTWHRDREDRIVIPINENDWLIQFDNELPRKLNVDEEFFIPKNSFHRVIKGKSDLVVEIIETTFEEDEYDVYEILEEGKKKKKKKKKDTCYYKVRSRYDVWPSAYASGALVKCRKAGAKNWGNSTDESINEEVTSSEPKEDTILTKGLNILSNFIRGKEVNAFLNKIKTVQTFGDFILKPKKATEGSNGFEIVIFDKENKKKVGGFVAIVYKSSKTGLYNLQIRKAYTFPDYRGRGIMRTFYQEFNEWLKKTFNNFDKFTSDFIFLYNQETGNYDGFNMWEDLVKKGLARRLGPDSEYIPPQPDKRGMWHLEHGYALNEELHIHEAKKTDFSKEKEEGLHGWFARQGGKGKSKGWVDCNTCRKDPETGRKKCKSCGRKKGEKRDYPACRPTPSACGTRGKGKKWGKKSLEESIININVNSDLFKNRIPFLKQFKNFSEDNKVFFQKVDFNKDVDMFFGGDIINFKQVNTSIEFSYIIDKIHDNYFHMFNLKFELIIQPSDDLDDLTSKILMITFNKNINEKLSHFEEISSKNEKLNDEELNKIINIINGKFFEIENFITNKLKLNIKNPLNENIWNFK